MKYPIGYRYTNRQKRICTVVDFLTTKNREGVIVKERYVTTHNFMGQVVHDYDVPVSSIDMGMKCNDNI